MAEAEKYISYHKLVEEQREFFRTGTPAKLEHRRQQLLTLKKMLIDETDILTNAVLKDLGRLPKMTYGLELAFVLLEIDYALDNLKNWSSTKKVFTTFCSCTNRFSIFHVKTSLLNVLDSANIIKEPLGVALIISPWNYPLSLVLLPLIPAIAAGNTVIIKPSECAPHTAGALDDLFSQYFDSRFLAVVQGDVPDTTELLKERFDHIFYTGSVPVGKIIMAAAAKNLTPVTLELGGKSPVIVENDVDLELTARRICWGKYVNCGQTCLSPDYILVTAAVKPKLIHEIIKALREFYGAEPKNSPDYSKIINEKQFDRIANLLERTNGTILHKGGELDRGNLFIPPVIIDVNENDIFMEDEIFGPVMPIVTVVDFDDSLRVIRSKEKPLAIYIFTRSEKNIRRLYTETSSGGITVNDVMVHFLVDTLPFGGVGNSGLGSYHGKYGFDTFSHGKALLKRRFFGESLFSMRYPPMTEQKFKQFKVILGRRIALPSWLGTFFSHSCFLLSGVAIGFFIKQYYP